MYLKHDFGHNFEIVNIFTIKLKPCFSFFGGKIEIVF